MADERIVDVSTILSKWHDLLKDRWPNFPCQTFTMFMHNNSQELVRCRECKYRGSADCLMWHAHYAAWGEYMTRDYTVNDGFCHKGAKMDAKDTNAPTKDGGAT